MKRLLILVCLLFLVIGVSAQSRLTEEQREEAIARYQEYLERLNLTEDQKPKVEEINMNFFEGLSNLKQSSGSRLDKYRTFKELSDKRDAEMKKVLTREQYAIYKENQQEQRQNFKERRRSQR
jgi:Spy/CpxP family protein refolding chaperone